MKKPLIIVFCLALLAAFATAAAAGDKTQVDVYDRQELVKSVVFVIGQDQYFVNNETPGVKMDAAPFIKSGRTFVPIRYLSNALGVVDKYIGWESPTVTLDQPGMPVVELAVGQKQIKSDDQAKAMDVAPMLTEGRTYLPARFVAEALGYQVGWDSENNAVLCWPKGTEKPDVSNVIEYIGGEPTQEEPPEQPGEQPVDDSKIDLSKVRPFEPDGTMASLGYGDAPYWEDLMGSWVKGEGPENQDLMYITLAEINSGSGVRVGNNVIFHIDYNPNDTANGHPRFAISIDQYDLGYRSEVGASGVVVNGLLKGDKVLTRNVAGGGDLVGFDGDKSRIRPDERFTETYGVIDRWGDKNLAENTTHIVISECSATGTDGNHALIVEL